MIERKHFATATATLFLFLAGCASNAASGRRSEGDFGPPRLFVAENPKDLGRAVSGQRVTSALVVKNAGGSGLRITKVETSCGCTAVETPALALEPGSAARLDVTVDTRGKFGEVRKAVFLHSNDPVEPVKAVTLRLFVVDGDHASTSVGRQSIFEGSCRRCHMDPGEGRYGEALYEASCAMCHRSSNAGGGPGLPRQALQNRPASEVRAAIRDGVEGTSMAAFHNMKGGPLDDSQIESVVRYLLGEPSAALAAALVPDGPGGRKARALPDSK